MGGIWKLIALIAVVGAVFLLIPIPLALFMGATRKVVNPAFVIVAIALPWAFFRQRKEMGG